MDTAMSTPSTLGEKRGRAEMEEGVATATGTTRHDEEGEGDEEVLTATDAASEAEVAACVKALITLAKQTAQSSALASCATSGSISDGNTPSSPSSSCVHKAAAVIALLDPKSPANYGAILRACGCYARAAAVSGSGGAPSSTTSTTGSSSAILYDTAVIYSGDRLQQAIAAGNANVGAQQYTSDRQAGLVQGNRAPKGHGVTHTDTMAAGQRIPQWHIHTATDYTRVMEGVRAALRSAAAAESTASPPLSVRFIAVTKVDRGGAVEGQSLPLFGHYLHGNIANNSSPPPPLHASSSGDDSPPPPYPTTTHAVVYLLAPEDGPIPPSVVAACDGAVHINMNDSINVSAMVNVLLFDRQSKYEQIEAYLLGEGDAADDKEPAPLPFGLSWLLAPPLMAGTN